MASELGAKSSAPSKSHPVRAPAMLVDLCCGDLVRMTQLELCTLSPGAPHRRSRITHSLPRASGDRDKRGAGIRSRRRRRGRSSRCTLGDRRAKQPPRG